MKSITRLLVCGLLLSFMAGEVSAQVQYSRKYRVVAYKKGDPNVFSESNEVEIVPPMAFYIPNSFTPNGDGINDTFGISGEAIKDFRMLIFNRWGEKIFESDNANVRWDGTFQGVKVPEGGYVYRVIARGPAGNQEQKEGSLLVIM